MANNHQLEASLLAFNTQNPIAFNEQLEKMKSNNINIIHYDVMDQGFVNNVAYGTEHLETLFKKGFQTNVHFMVMDPMKYSKNFLKYPLNAITFHPEPISMIKAWRTIKYIQNKGKKAGLAFKPQTNLLKYKFLIKKCDIVTIMGVEPGRGGQPFLEKKTLENLKKIQSIKEKFNKKLIIQLDGGVNYDVVPKTFKNVDNYISGSFLIKEKDPVNFLNFIKKI